VRLETPSWQPRELALDARARHLWWPVAPTASIEVELEQPALRFRGVGYHDANAGCEALEQAFSGWSWTRGSDADGTALLYDVTGHDGLVRELGLQHGADGALGPIEAAARHQLGSTRWRLPRPTRTDAGGNAMLRRTLVDTPFYARSWIDTQLGGRALTAMHEVVDLRRFERTSTQWMLPFRTRGVG
jgi:carotenoid 1,2-hydratase